VTQVLLSLQYKVLNMYKENIDSSVAFTAVQSLEHILGEY